MIYRKQCKCISENYIFFFSLTPQIPQALQTVDLKAYITRVGTAPAGMGAGTGGAPGGDKPEVAPEAPTTAAAAAVEEEDSDDDDMGLSLFD